MSVFFNMILPKLAIMSASLAFLGIVHALTIDSQLAVIKSDCYERLAIGQRLRPNDVYLKLEHNTVKECQMACTKDHDKCQSFSFGIAVKGNATCELSSVKIKETVDLKPIGTMTASDYDLFIKKMDCTIVTENTTKPNIPTTQKALDKNYQFNRPEQTDDIQQVQMAVSVSSGLQKSILHPVHDILIAEDVYYNLNEASLNKIYRPGYDLDRYDRQNFNRHGSTSQDFNGYGQNIDKYDDFKPNNYGSIRPHSRPNFNRYDVQRPNDRPYSVMDRFGSSNSNKYGGTRPYSGLNLNRYVGTSPILDQYENYRPNRPYFVQNFDKNDGIRTQFHHSRPDLNRYGDFIPDSRPHFNKFASARPHLGSNRPDSNKNGDQFGNTRPDLNKYRDSRPDPRPHSNRFGSIRPELDGYGNTKPDIGSIRPDSEGIGGTRPDSRPNSGDYDNIRPDSRPHSNRFGGTRPDSDLTDNRRPYMDEHNYGPRPHNSEYLFRPGFDPSLDNYKYVNKDKLKPSVEENQDNKKHNPKPLITQSVGPDGERITSIITEIQDACFRRVLAGKRVSRHFVRKVLNCEQIEDCQQECADEKNFACEGFNYRLDLSGHSKGQCELLDIPFSYLDIPSDLYPDPVYDYYEKDRNSNCQPPFYPENYDNHFNRGKDDWKYSGNRRADYYPYEYKPYEPFHPPLKRPFVDKPIKDYWGFNKQNWGSYGGFYGSFGGGTIYKPYLKKNYLPFKTGQYGSNYGDWDRNYVIKRPQLPPSSYEGQSFGHNGLNFYNDFYSSILPAEPRLPGLKDECSLRSAAGFRLHKDIVKKFFSVPSIYECEVLCFKEKEFVCASYAFRYTVTLTAPTDNCYLSDRNYKELDFYTDLQPDRDFDIYTMNNRNTCEGPKQRKEQSDCFWRVRSAQRLDHKVVRDSLTVKSIMECQIECLRSAHFTCRSFSFRFGSPVIGGAIDNCQLTDWPYYELERIDLVPELGFELYERGSFGYGCEVNHFGIRGNMHLGHEQLCYIGFGSPARLLPEATRRSSHAPSELDCKKECSRFRSGAPFQCMSFSYKTTTGRIKETNCHLSDIMQRDLLPNIDYVSDPDSWLFAWDNYNPDCIALAIKPVQNNEISNRAGYGDEHPQTFRPISDLYNPLDTWRMYSVNGWPCRHGSLCQENREAGFWFCHIEGGGSDSWDYCCRPDHQCGLSEGFPYQWCYVGPIRTQWRQCSDRYYPYSFAAKPYLPNHISDSYRPSFRPDRPPRPLSPHLPPSGPSLDDYEQQFAQQFLDPPKPGGFGPARHWPVSYLHKMKPSNDTSSKARSLKDDNPKYAAIKNLIDIIKSNDLKNVQYQITNNSNKQDDILYVKIPLPSFNDTGSSSTMRTEINNTRRFEKALPFETKSTMDNVRTVYPVYRKGYVSRTNLTNFRKRSTVGRYLTLSD